MWGKIKVYTWYVIHTQKTHKEWANQVWQFHHLEMFWDYSLKTHNTFPALKLSRFGSGQDWRPSRNFKGWSLSNRCSHGNKACASSWEADSHGGHCKLKEGLDPYPWAALKLHWCWKAEYDWAQSMILSVPFRGKKSSLKLWRAAASCWHEWARGTVLVQDSILCSSYVAAS